MKVLSMVNQKGGVGKTTSCLNVGAALTKLGKKVLLIDFDPQGSLSEALGLIDLRGKPTTLEVMTGEAKINDAIIHIKPKYDILPLDLRMAGSESATAPIDQERVKEALSGVRRKYDYVLIDCSPSLSRITLSALGASDYAIIPTSSQFMSIRSLLMLQETINAVKKTMNPKLKIGGIIITLYDSRRRFDKEMEKAIRNAFPETLQTVVKYNSKLAELPAVRQDIFEYDPKGQAAASYMEITKELLSRGI